MPKRCLGTIPGAGGTRVNKTDMPSSHQPQEGPSGPPDHLQLLLLELHLQPPPPSPQHSARPSLCHPWPPCLPSVSGSFPDSLHQPLRRQPTTPGLMAYFTQRCFITDSELDKPERQLHCLRLTQEALRHTHPMLPQQIGDGRHPHSLC